MRLMWQETGEASTPGTGSGSQSLLEIRGIFCLYLPPEASVAGSINDRYEAVSGRQIPLPVSCNDGSPESLGHWDDDNDRGSA
jgi:hypothetical protein